VSIFYRSDTIPGRLHSAERWATVLEQGTGEIWGGEPEATTAAAPVVPNEANEPIADFIFNAQNRAEDIALVRAMGFEVDDDSEPAPENIPVANAPLFRLGGGSTKGRSGDGMGSTSGPRSGERCTMGLCSQTDGLPSGRRSWRSSSTSSQFLTNVIVERTSSALVGVNSARTRIGEMLRYDGMWLLMLCYMKSPDYFWQSAPRTTTTPDDD
jgi:hypothetical protein